MATRSPSRRQRAGRSSRRCGGRLRLLATIADRATVAKILTHLGLPVALPRPEAARTPSWLPGVRERADHESDAGGHWAHWAD